MADMTQASPALGQGILGLGIGLVLFSLVYVITVRTDIAQPRDGMWPAIFLALLIVPTAIMAFRGRSKPAA